MIFRVSLLFILIGLIFNSCRHPVPEGPEMFFAKDVQPIIISNCTQSGCHGTTSTAEFTLLTYDDVMENGDVKPGDPEDSELYEVLVTNDLDDRMPLNNPPLSESQIKIIYLWIKQGAKNN